MCLKAHWFSASICTESQNAISPTVLLPNNLPHPGYHQTHLHGHNKNLPDHHNPAHRTYLVIIPAGISTVSFFPGCCGRNKFHYTADLSVSADCHEFFCPIAVIPHISVLNVLCSFSRCVPPVMFCSFLFCPSEKRNIYVFFLSPFGTYHISLYSSSIPSPF